MADWRNGVIISTGFSTSFANLVAAQAGTDLDGAFE
jgi:hypothetical protein